MRVRTIGAVVLLTVTLAALFVVFVPVVPQTQPAPCYLTCRSNSGYTAHYSASVSFVYFNIGGVYQGCNGYQLVGTTHAGPRLCDFSS